MIQIVNNLFVGTKEEYQIAKEKGMKIVCALNRCTGFPSHQSAVGWSGRGCDPQSPYYLYKEEKDVIYLNMIDGDNPDYVNDDMVNAALSFIKRHLSAGESVFIYCSLGESRGPSIALLYMLENNLIEKINPIQQFKSQYPEYNPRNGNLLYIKRRWGIA